MLAHSVVRRVMPDAAVGTGPDPDRLSFLDCLRVLPCPWPESPQVDTETWDRRLLREVGDQRLRPRRNRGYPGVIKRKRSNGKKRRPEPRNPPQPTKTFRDAVVLVIERALGPDGRLPPVFAGRKALPSAPETRHDAPMGKLRRLQDISRFPGFVPMAEVRGIFGDPYAVVITLRRRRKKRAAACGGECLAPSTTSGHGASATSPAATGGSTSISGCGGSDAPGVAA